MKDETYYNILNIHSMVLLELIEKNNNEISLPIHIMDK